MGLPAVLYSIGEATQSAYAKSLFGASFCALLTASTSPLALLASAAQPLYPKLNDITHGATRFLSKIKSHRELVGLITVYPCPDEHLTKSQYRK